MTNYDKKDELHKLDDELDLLSNELKSEDIVKNQAGSDPHHPDHLRNRADKTLGDATPDELSNELNKRLGNDPQHPDHPRNRVDEVFEDKASHESSKERNQKYGSDPHHPDHPRNRA